MPVFYWAILLHLNSLIIECNSLGISAMYIFVKLSLAAGYTPNCFNFVTRKDSTMTRFLFSPNRSESLLLGCV